MSWPYTSGDEVIAPCPFPPSPQQTRVSWKPLSRTSTSQSLAGMGKIGWHSLLITEEFGPRVRLACLLTEADMEPSPRTFDDLCSGCGACVTHCPAKSLEVPANDTAYAMNKFSCRAYRQAGLTCSVCMKVCDEALGGRR